MNIQGYINEYIVISYTYVIYLWLINSVPFYINSEYNKIIYEMKFNEYTKGLYCFMDVRELV